MSEHYDPADISRLVGISQSQIRYWERTGLIPSVGPDRGKLLFEYRSLVAFRTVKALLDRGVSLRRIRKALERLRRTFPEAREPLSEIHLFVEGGEVVASRGSVTFRPDGQLVMDFSAQAGEAVPLCTDRSEEWFFQALELEEEGDWEKALERYDRALAADPRHADALVNRGNILHRLGRMVEAEASYRCALEADPTHVEASYNLANVLEERGDTAGAVSLHRRTLELDSEFADSHFNLALILERAGAAAAARRHWQRYVDLEPAGDGADLARSRLKPK